MVNISCMECGVVIDTEVANGVECLMYGNSYTGVERAEVEGECPVCEADMADQDHNVLQSEGGNHV